jgi:hypothetical protein
MIESFLGTLFGCSHKRTTFPLTPSRKSKRSGTYSGTYVVCLKCGKEFDYNWQEMRIGSPIGEFLVSPGVLPAEQTSAQ